MRSGDQTAAAIPTLSQVQTQWQPWKLNEAGEEIKARNTDFVTMIDKTVTQIREAGSHWSGDAYYAAYDRIAGDRDTANKMAQETTELANALINGGNTLTGYRQALLDKVTEATAAGYQVSEDWQVTASGEGSGDDLHTYQTAITTALNEMVGTQSGIATAIEQANTAVQTQSTALGTGDPLDTLTGQPKSTLTAEQISAEQPAATVPAGTEEKSKENPQTPAAGTPKNIAEEGKPTTEQPKVTEQSKDNPVAKPVTEPTTPVTPATAAPATSGPASNPDSWKPENVINLISTIGTITGNVPTLIESVAKFDDDWDDLIKAGGEAGKGLLDSAGTAAEKVIDSVDKAVDSVPGEAPKKDEPAAAPQPGTPDSGTPATPQSGTPATPPSGTPATPPSGTPATPPSGTPATPPSGTPATPPSGTPATPPAATYTQPSSLVEQTPAATGVPASTASPAATAPASSSLFGLPSPTRGSESDSEHRPNNYVAQTADAVTPEE
ncbi:hypothetical protein [Nocardia sp. CS682]|uniref:hypothetical protein n=1 Tax=Nocardia sp. CS682 TaxID=1047172 RepID=UPI00143154A0|nr:hypothetical protein [Nocardia sp. CS682]